MPPYSEPKEGETLLKLQDVHMHFGKVGALAGVDLEVKKGEIHSIIGPNGAGKTVMMNCINGLYKPQQGEIHFKGQKINDLKPYRRAELGISRTFQKIELFGGMSVLDNIRLGRHIHLKSGIISGALYVGRTKREELSSRRFIEEEIIDLLEIESIRHKTVHMLPYGLQKGSNWAGRLPSIRSSFCWTNPWRDSIWKKWRIWPALSSTSMKRTGGRSPAFLWSMIWVLSWISLTRSLF